MDNTNNLIITVNDTDLVALKVDQLSPEAKKELGDAIRATAR